MGRLASGLEDGEDMGQVGGETSLPPDVGQDDMDSLAASCTSLSQLLRGRVTTIVCCLINYSYVSFYEAV